MPISTIPLAMPTATRQPDSQSPPFKDLSASPVPKAGRSVGLYSADDLSLVCDQKACWKPQTANFLTFDGVVELFAMNRLYLQRYPMLAPKDYMNSIIEKGNDKSSASTELGRGFTEPSPASLAAPDSLSSAYSTMLPHVSGIVSANSGIQTHGNQGETRKGKALSGNTARSRSCSGSSAGQPRKRQKPNNNQDDNGDNPSDDDLHRSDSRDDGADPNTKKLLYRCPYYFADSKSYSKCRLKTLPFNRLKESHIKRFHVDNKHPADDPTTLHALLKQSDRKENKLNIWNSMLKAIKASAEPQPHHVVASTEIALATEIGTFLQGLFQKQEKQHHFNLPNGLVAIDPKAVEEKIRAFVDIHGRMMMERNPPGPKALKKKKEPSKDCLASSADHTQSVSTGYTQSVSVNPPQSVRSQVMAPSTALGQMPSQLNEPNVDDIPSLTNPSTNYAISDMRSHINQQPSRLNLQSPVNGYVLLGDDQSQWMTEIPEFMFENTDAHPSNDPAAQLVDETSFSQMWPLDNSDNKTCRSFQDLNDDFSS